MTLHDLIINKLVYKNADNNTYSIASTAPPILLNDTKEVKSITDLGSIIEVELKDGPSLHILRHFDFKVNTTQQFFKALVKHHQFDHTASSIDEVRLSKHNSSYLYTFLLRNIYSDSLTIIALRCDEEYGELYHCPIANLAHSVIYKRFDNEHYHFKLNDSYIFTNDITNKRLDIPANSIRHNYKSLETIISYAQYGKLNSVTMLDGTIHNVPPKKDPFSDSQ